ncbi:helix-turn-helix transcriptional regulator [Pantoea ananatis]|uniref:helix-turn-helix transcriptional regulator n=1 Tax=Pantoea ananas TaxID=553 RepID=UPI000496D082|nr:transcriptional regulator [Pantoea ananatis]
MEEYDSPGRFLAFLLAKYNMTIEQLCKRSGLKEHEVEFVLRDRVIITPALADKLGKVFHTSEFWIIRQAEWELRKLQKEL